MENSIEEDIAKVNTYIELVLEKDYCNCNELNTILGKHCDGSKNVAYAIEHILSDYKRVLKENEELTISNKEIDKECSRLEKKEIELINENEHYKDLIYALKTYYDITEEDLEKCMKNDRSRRVCKN